MLMKIKNDNAVVDEDYLYALIAKASQTWKGMDAKAWLDEIGGDYAE